jgi:tetratricopeptide (TPR) repeat protein
MAYKDPRFAEVYEEIEELTKELHRVQKELGHEKNRTIKRKHEQKIGNLKWLIAWSLIDCREFQKGLAIYDSLSWRTHGEEKYIGIGRALVDMEHYAEARRVLEKGFNRFPGSAFLCIMLGTAYHLEKHDHAALLYYNYVLQYDPENQNALYQKALSLNSLGCYEEAAPILQGLTMKYPDDPDYIAEMGIFWARGIMRKPSDTIHRLKIWDTFGQISMPSSILHIAAWV